MPTVLLRILVLGLLLGAWAAPVAAQDLPAQREEARDARLRQAIDLVLRDHQPDAAIALLDPLIDDYRQRYATRDQRVYCPRTEDEGQQYLADALRQAPGSSVLLSVHPTWAYALYYKGYALIDLRRLGEARHALNQALQLAPHNAQFLAELAGTYQNDDDWTRMLALAQQAADATAFSPPDLREDELGRALRGQGYALVELARWDEAEQAYRHALQLDPGDLQAHNELDYVLSHRPSP